VGWGGGGSVRPSVNVDIIHCTLMLRDLTAKFCVSSSDKKREVNRLKTTPSSLQSTLHTRVKVYMLSKYIIFGLSLSQICLSANAHFQPLTAALGILYVN
jgi:hypothetical protein